MGNLTSMLKANVVVWLWLFFLWGCGGQGTDAGTGTPPKQPGVRVIAGDGVSDTIETVLAGELVAEVIGANGRPAPGVSVGFVPMTCKSVRGDDPSVFVARFGTPDQDHVIDTTDSRGIASTRVRLGLCAGQALVELRSALGSDTASFTVRPGAPVFLEALPPDSAVYVGQSLTYRAYAFDRRGNVRQGDSLSTSVLGGPLATDGAGRVSGTRFGRGSIIVRLREFADTVMLSVVPRASLVAITATLLSDDSAHVVALEADGSAYRVLARTLVGGWPHWSPTTQSRIVFHNVVAGGGLYTLDIGGTMQRLIPVGAAPPVQVWPQYSKDGAWVYFAAGNDDLYREIWRVRSDGAQAQRVGPPLPSYASDYQPSAAPDGRRVVFASTRRFRDTDGYPSLWTLDVASGSITDLQVAALSPKWSPDGTLIAYVDPLDHFIKVIQPDGSGVRTVSDPRFLFLAGLDWSPDSHWIVGNTDEDLAMIEVSSSLTIPIDFPIALWQPSWR